MLRRILVPILVIVTLLAAGTASSAATRTPPNILLILADDLGFTDLGSFGSEIDTPNLDQLASHGVRLTNFHAGATCAPSRAMLLTGTDNHIAGVGSQRGLVTPSQQGSPAYKNELHPDIPTIAELLKAADYQTLAVTKWHVGHQANVRPGARGFDRSFALLEGGARHFDGGEFMEGYGTTFVENDQPTTYPTGSYSTDFMTDRMISYLSDIEKDKPFFALLGVTAPHWPLQAPADSIEKYKGRYDTGWDTLRDERLQGAIRQGIIPEGSAAVLKEPGVKDWNTLSAEQKARQARTMAVYAAMIDRLDVNVGRLVAHLDESGRLDNTIIMFLSDNGAEPFQMELYANRTGWIDRNFSSAIDDIGSANSYVTLGPGWTRAVTAPLRDSKGNLAEGGVRVPAFITLPHRRSGGLDHSYMNIMDIAPTLLEAAGVTAAPHFRGRSQFKRIQGGPAVYGPSDVIAFELFGRRSVTKGKWKALFQNPPYGPGDWQLYDLSTDPGEQLDLSLKHPEVKKSLINEWEKYAQEVGVILPDSTVR